MSKGDPIPTRFDEPENEAIAEIHRRTGLPNAEIIRRAVRLLAQHVKARGSVGFILEELSPAPLEHIRKVKSYSAEERRKKRSSG